ncbi:hypothetical protein ABPG75_000582 [Micractinium tetrahymenae]
MGLAATKPTIARMSSAKQIVDQAIAGNKVCVFSKTYCPYCTKAKRALQRFLKNFYVMELDGRNDGAAIQDYLLEITGGRSVPRVFVGGKFIGGGDDTDALARNGQLEKLLLEVGAI